MSPTLKKHYQEKDNRRAFYIVQDELHRNRRCPPVASTMIAMEDDIAKITIPSSRAKLPKTLNTPMQAGIRINRNIVSIKKSEKEKKEENDKKIKLPIRSKIPGIKNEIQCPTPSNRWINYINHIVPKVIFN